MTYRMTSANLTHTVFSKQLSLWTSPVITSSPVKVIPTQSRSNMNGVWVIGDSPNDVRGGKSAGASTVWLENPLHGHNAHEKREKTIRGLAKTALRTAVQDIVPTVTIRTFDPEEMGYSRTTALSDMDKEEVRKLTTVNRGLAEFLIMRGKRSQLYRLEHVRNALLAQGSSLSTNSQQGLNAVMSQGSTSKPRRINKQAVLSYHTREDARIGLDRMLAREGVMLNSHRSTSSSSVILSRSNLSTAAQPPQQASFGRKLRFYILRINCPLVVCDWRGERHRLGLMIGPNKSI